jgi:hypothetical protein
MRDFTAQPARWWPGFRRDHPLARDCIGFWPAWEGQGTRAYDVAHPFATGGHGTLSGDTGTPTWAAGRYGRGLSYVNASDQWVNVPTAPRFDLTDAVSIAALVRTDSAPAGWAGIVGKWASDAGERAYLLVMEDDEQPGMYVTGGSLSAASAVVANTWYALVGTYDRVNINLYVDGVGETPVAENGVMDTVVGPVHIGVMRTDHADKHGWGGAIGPVGIWSRALSAAEAEEWSAEPYALVTPRQRTYSYVTAAAVGNPWYYYAQQEAVA